MNKFAEWWRSDPKARFYVRTVVVAIIGYVVTSINTGFGDWKSVVGGAIAAGMNAVIGLVTPVEPFVGIKAKRADVPVPPAAKEEGP